MIAERVELVPAADAPRALAGAELIFEGVPETLDAKRDGRSASSTCIGSTRPT
jgi:hypothetical protein